MYFVIDEHIQCIRLRDMNGNVIFFHFPSAGWVFFSVGTGHCISTAALFLKLFVNFSLLLNERADPKPESENTNTHTPMVRATVPTTLEVAWHSWDIRCWLCAMALDTVVHCCRYPWKWTGSIKRISQCINKPTILRTTTIRGSHCLFL